MKRSNRGTSTAGFVWMTDIVGNEVILYRGDQDGVDTVSARDYENLEKCYEVLLADYKDCGKKEEEEEKRKRRRLMKRSNRSTLTDGDGNDVMLFQEGQEGQEGFVPGIVKKEEVPITEEINKPHEMSQREESRRQEIQAVQLEREVEIKTLLSLIGKGETITIDTQIGNDFREIITVTKD